MASNEPVDKLTQAASILRATYNIERSEQLDQWLWDNLQKVRELIADLLTSTHEDWYSAHIVRKPYAGYSAPYGKSEKAAYLLALLALREEQEKPKDVPDPNVDKA